MTSVSTSLLPMFTSIFLLSLSTFACLPFYSLLSRCLLFRCLLLLSISVSICCICFQCLRLRECDVYFPCLLSVSAFGVYFFGVCFRYLLFWFLLLSIDLDINFSGVCFRCLLFRCLLRTIKAQQEQTKPSSRHSSYMHSTRSHIVAHTSLRQFTDPSNFTI